ncbi:MAG: DUF3291 domain-containing protein [Fimbriimonadaceae bacterium]|nr:DUF3291 domain-containing protein [Chitinophagales bacterium]
MNFHLAQLNVARLLQPLDHADTKEFIDGLIPVNALAESSNGFVWRLKDDAGDATAIEVFTDKMIIVNMSMWEDMETFKNFVYKTMHTEYIRNKSKWFEKHDTFYFVMWWVEAGHIPTVQEAKERLEYLQQNGDSAFAFSMKKIFPQPNANASE